VYCSTTGSTIETKNLSDWLITTSPSSTSLKEGCTPYLLWKRRWRLTIDLLTPTFLLLLAGVVVRVRSLSSSSSSRYRASLSPSFCRCRCHRSLIVVEEIKFVVVVDCCRRCPCCLFVCHYSLSVVVVACWLLIVILRCRRFWRRWCEENSNSHVQIQFDFV
jgi:hypothetical protein